MTDRLTLIRRTCVALVAATATACALAAPPKQVRFRCDDGSALRVLFVPGAAKVTPTGDRTFRLPQQRSGSGFRYATPRQELRGKGNEVTWTVGRRAPVQCTVRR